ncbi:MAG: hypothetical protein LBT63_02560 [Holosporaceae bacterium]|jgi:hypothetical protein|nr:hypothetical protein [Holosporaceae bacterium]
MMIKSKKSLVFVAFCASCSRYEAPSLPDLNRKSFSYDDVMQKQIVLKKRITEAQSSTVSSSEYRPEQ